MAVTPRISITYPPGTLDFESLQKKARFDQDIDLSRGGVYDPDAIDDLISWLEGNRRQEVVVQQLADQVGNLNPGSVHYSQVDVSATHLARWVLAQIHLG